MICDALGSYEVGYYVVGGAVIAAAIILLIIPLLGMRKNRIENSTLQED